MTVKVDCPGAVACPGTNESELSSASHSAERPQADGSVQEAPRGVDIDSIQDDVNCEPCAAEVASDSEDTLCDFESTEAPGTDDDELSGFSSDESVLVKRSLWDAAQSEEHELTHKPGLPIRCHEYMVAKARRKPVLPEKLKRKLSVSAIPSPVTMYL